MDEETEDWIKLHNEDLRNLYSSPDIITKKLRIRRIKLTGRVACMGVMKMRTKFSLESLKGKDNSEDLGEHGMIVEPLFNSFSSRGCIFVSGMFSDARNLCSSSD